MKVFSEESVIFAKERAITKWSNKGWTKTVLLTIYWRHHIG